MPLIKAVLFDFDGTLMDTNQIILESWRHTYRAAGKPVPSDEYIASYFGETLYNTMLTEFPDLDPDRMVETYRTYQRNIFKGTIQMCPGTEELVLGLHEKGYLQGIVTSRLWSSTLKGVYQFPVADLFDVVISAEDTAAHKPDPTGIFMAMDRLGICRDQAVYVGDSKYDMMCAKNAGIPAILVDWTVCLPPEKRVGAAAPNYLIRTAEELYGVLDILNSGRILTHC